MARENRLKEAIGAIRGKYDYVFIDCPPSLGLLTVNDLVAADKLLIPIQCEFYALRVTKLLDSMKRVKTYLNPSLDIFGVLLTMYDGRTTLSKQVANEVRGFFDKRVFDVVIPRSVKVSEALVLGFLITEYDTTGKGAEAYRTPCGKEVIQRGERTLEAVSVAVSTLSRWAAMRRRPSLFSQKRASSWRIFPPKLFPR